MKDSKARQEASQGETQVAIQSQRSGAHACRLNFSAYVWFPGATFAGMYSAHPILRHEFYTRVGGGITHAVYHGGRGTTKRLRDCKSQFVQIGSRPLHIEIAI